MNKREFRRENLLNDKNVKGKQMWILFDCSMLLGRKC